MGRDIFHLWQEESGEKKSFMGRIEKVKATNVCKVGYWDVKGETHEDAVDFDISLYALGADVISEDLFLSAKYVFKSGILEKLWSGGCNGEELLLQYTTTAL